MKANTQKLTVLAMFGAISYALVFFIRIWVVPAAPFLEYEPKTVIIVIAGFLFGPLSALVLSVLVPALEMVTFSPTGPIGFLMNVLATSFFACTAAAIYKLRRTLAGAVIGLAAGTLIATGVMLLWNYIITPLYMPVTREIVAGMLMPVFMPFNLLKNSLNAGFTMALYKPVRIALKQARLLPASGTESGGRKASLGMAVISVFIIATCVLLIMAWRGII